MLMLNRMPTILRVKLPTDRVVSTTEKSLDEYRWSHQRNIAVLLRQGLLRVYSDPGLENRTILFGHFGPKFTAVVTF